MNKMTIYRSLAAYFVLLLFSFGSTYGQNNDVKPIVSTLIVLPREIALDQSNQKSPLLIAWQITNKSTSLVRFRIRDLGQLMIFDPDGKRITGETGGVDHTKKFELKDYPVISPNQTLYFPFAISFYNHHRLGRCLQVKSDPNGQEAWIYPISKDGIYSILAKYSVKKFNKNESDLMWDSELKVISGPGFGCENFWEGDLQSEEIKLTVR